VSRCRSDLGGDEFLRQYRHPLGLALSIADFEDDVGARPGDLPVEQPSRYELAINLATAQALGISIPKAILVQADQVIE
jgi:putative ABC transport system substrate-binding protein